MIKGILFDLDGVITDTAEYHYLAWKSLADRYKLDFNRKINERLKGVSRVESLNIILEVNDCLVDSQTFEQMLEEKNRYYVSLLDNITPDDLLPGIKKFLNEVEQNQLKTAVASASKNARYVLKKLELEDFFDVIVDVGTVKKSKPDPEIFIKAYEMLGLNCDEVIGIEDSQAGIDALNKANIKSIGIGSCLKNSSMLLQSTSDLTYSMIQEDF